MLRNKLPIFIKISNEIYKTCMTIGLGGLSLYIINNSGEFPKKDIRKNNYTYFPKENDCINFYVENTSKKSEHSCLYY